jgi:hypothetical protein
MAHALTSKLFWQAIKLSVSSEVFIEPLEEKIRIVNNPLYFGNKN